MNSNNKQIRDVAEVAARIMAEALKGNQHKIDANKNGKIDAEDFKLLKAKKEVKEEAEELDEGRMKELSMDLKDMSHDEFHKTYGKPKSHFDPSNFKKPVQKGHEMDRAKALAQRGIASVRKEDVEQITEAKYSVNVVHPDSSHKHVSDEGHKKAADNFVKKAQKHGLTAKVHNYNGPGGGAAEVHLSHKDPKHVEKFIHKHYDQDDDLSHYKIDEEVEQIEEDITKTSTGYIHHARPGVYGGSAKEKHVVDTLSGPKRTELDAIDKEKDSKLYKKPNAAQKGYNKTSTHEYFDGTYNRNIKKTKPNFEEVEQKKMKFSEMINLYNEYGLKAINQMIVQEEPDNEQFTKELKDQEAKAAGKKKQADVAKGAVQAVQSEETHTQVEVLDYTDVNGVKISTIDLDERHLSGTEMEKKETIVKSMKKGIAGFKERYGDRAKEVMYATATKQAKGE